MIFVLDIFELDINRAKVSSMHYSFLKDFIGYFLYVIILAIRPVLKLFQLIWFHVSIEIFISDISLSWSYYSHEFVELVAGYSKQLY